MASGSDSGVEDAEEARAAAETRVEVAEEVTEGLRAELDECVQNINRVEKLVSNPNFLSKAKQEVVETEPARLQDLKERQQHLSEILDQLAG